MNKSTYEQSANAKLPREDAKTSRSEALAARVEAGAAALAAFANTLSQAQWQTRLSRDGRKVGVVVHHVASVYPAEIHLASLLASGKPIAGVSWDAIHTMNSDHAQANQGASKSDTLALLATNSAAAAAAIRGLTDDELDRAATVSLNGDAPLTCQFMIEDHALRHSYQHLANIRAALARQDPEDE